MKARVLFCVLALAAALAACETVNINVPGGPGPVGAGNEITAADGSHAKSGWGILWVWIDFAATTATEAAASAGVGPGASGGPAIVGNQPVTGTGGGQ